MGISACVTVEDKDPNILWVMAPFYLMVRWIYLLSRVPHRWRILHVPKSQVVSWYRMLLDFTIPKKLFRGRSQFSYANLPYAYPTIKLKCWTPSGVHRCQDPRHSCFRNICSFVRLPGRRVYRQLGRGLQHVMQYLTPGWGLRDMSQAFPLLVDRASWLKRPTRRQATGCYHCERCGREMSYPTLLVADAGQAYEDLDTSAIYTAVQELFERVPEVTKTHTVTITNTEKGYDTRWVGDYKIPHNDRTILSMSSMRRAVYGFLGMRIFRLGDVFLEQLQGIPIGGPLSGCILELVLSRYETLYDKANPFRRRHLATGR